MSLEIDQEQADLYTSGQLADDYEEVAGVFVLPLAVDSVAAGEPPVALVQAHHPYRKRKIRYEYSKQGTPPVVPKPATTGAFRFLGGELTIPAPVPNLNGSFEWTVAGSYVFVSTVATTGNEGYILTSSPFILPSQIVAQTGASSSAAQPGDVQAGGIGPKVGWMSGQQVKLEDPAYSYNEPSYLPAIFFSSSLGSGPDTYPSLG